MKLDAQLLGQEEQPDLCPPATPTTAPTAPAATPDVPSTAPPATPPAAPPAGPPAAPPTAPSAAPPAAPAAPVAVAGRAKDGASSSDYTVGTAAQLIAQGAQQASACCTRLTFGTKQGWVVLCSAHMSLQRSEQARSVVPRKPPDPPLPTVARWPAAQPLATTSISARWRHRQQIKKQRMKRRRCTASSGVCETDCDSD